MRRRPVQSAREANEWRRPPSEVATALDDDPGVRPVLHEHVADKPAWLEILDDLPRFAGSPPMPEGESSD